MFEGSIAATPLALLARVIALLVAISVHEYAHALVADRLGDATAREAGRLTLNPLKHLSLWGALFLFLFRFGWSKPVPVNAYNFRNPRQGTLLVSLAGPLANFLTAAVFAILMRLVPGGTHLPILVQEIVILNLVLMIFNLFPIPPLDGSSILPFVFDRRGQLLYALERQGFLLLFGLIVFDALSGGRILGLLIGVPVFTLANLLLGSGAFLPS
jgi:Zn-dependent protease